MFGLGYNKSKSSSGGTNFRKVVFRQEFIGDGSTVTFTLTGTNNATFSSGSWNSANILTTMPFHVTSISAKKLWDSNNVFTRHRIEVISGGVNVTLNYAPKNSEHFYIWYWYELAENDVLSDYYREDFVASIEESESDIAKNISYDNSNTELSSNNIQDAIDEHVTDKSNNPHNVKASEIPIPTMGSPAIDTIQEAISALWSAGKISGGKITDNGDGTISVSAGAGFIKATDSDTAELKSFEWSTDDSVALTDNSTNYIYIEYNAGTPQVTASTSLPTDHNTNVLLGLVYRDGTDLHIVTAGQVISNYKEKTLFKDLEINGKFQRVKGIKISETGTRNFTITSGIVYAGLTKVNVPAFDSSGSDVFTYYYRDGGTGWIKETGKTQIDNKYYDDGTGTLAELSDPLGWRHYYGVHWVYQDIDGHVFVVYGQGNYSLTEAQNAQPPSTLPDIISSIGGLVGKIIIEKNASSFESIESAFDTPFVPSAVIEHNELAGIQGGSTDEYYHLTETEHAKVQNALENVVEDASPQLGGDLDAQSHRITNLSDPTNDQDAATKAYADNAMEKVSEVNVSSNCTYVDFTGLDGNSAWFYRLFASIKNPSGSDSTYYIYVNGDTTNTNYYNQFLQANGTTVNANRQNLPAIGAINSGYGGLFNVSITKDPDGYFRFYSAINRESGSGIKNLSRSGIKTATITNITSLRVQAETSNAIGAGSKLILFKVRRG